MKTGNKNSLFFLILISIIVYWIILPFILYLISLPVNNLMYMTWNSYNIRLAIAIILVITGIYIAIWSANTMFFMGKGYPLSSKPPKYLVKSGPYQYIRHPLYVSFFLYITGLGILISKSMTLIVNPIFLVILYFYTFKEEKILKRKYGKEYLKYRNQIPAIIPKFRRTRITSPNMVNPFVIFLYAIVSFLLRKLYYLNMEGELPDDIGPYIILSNHQSYLDPVYIVGTVGMPVRFITTEMMFKNPLMKRIFHSFGCIPLKRSSGIRSILETKKALRNNDIIGIFPEASRSWDGDLVGFDRRVVKFINSLNYPLVFTRLDGTYNSLPRWSKVYHRANVTVKITGIIYNPGELSEEELKKVMYEKLKGSKRVKTGWGSLNKYIETLLWKCPECGEDGSIKRKGAKKILCKICKSEWIVDPELNIISYLYKKMKKRLLKEGIDIPMKINEKIILNDNLLKIEDKEIPLEDISFIAIDGTSHIQFGLKGKRTLHISTKKAHQLKMSIEILRGARENLDWDPYWF